MTNEMDKNSIKIPYPEVFLTGSLKHSRPQIFALVTTNPSPNPDRKSVV